MIRTPSRRVKPARKSARPSAPFGAGILHSSPYHGTMPFTAADLEWAAQTFGDDEPDWDALAAEAEGYDRVVAGCYA
jgi:hypothetical protein